jgi:stress-induced morphogen
LKDVFGALTSQAAAEDTAQAVSAPMPQELMDAMKAKISEALETDTVSVRNMSGDGRHVEIDVVSKLFEGQSTMQRQRMVYKSIWLELQDHIHAVDAMTTKTPAEAGL